MTESMQPISPGLVSDLVAAIYDCAIDPDRWPGALEAIVDATGFAGAALAVNELPSMKVLMHSTAGIEPRWLVRLADYADDLAGMWGGLDTVKSAPMDAVHVNSDYTPPEKKRTFAYYREWLQPQGYADGAVLILVRDPRAIGSLGFFWSVGQGPIGDRQKELCRLILPHLQRATAISRLLDVQALARAGLAATLNALRAGVVLVTRDLRIVYANDAAGAAMQRGEAIRTSQGRFVVDEPVAAAALASAVRLAADNEAGIGRRGLGIPAGRGARAPLALHVLPLRHGALRRGLLPDAAAAIFISDLAAGPDAPLEMLAALFDLTTAESKVFQLIAAGETRERAAELLGVQLSTVKTHLVRIYAKTGASRAADLVKLAARLATPL
jgi:DNA-binding CsgD family transcriptional regulator/PAS domain-containing protein